MASCALAHLALRLLEAAGGALLEGLAFTGEAFVCMVPIALREGKIVKAEVSMRKEAERKTT